MHINQAVVVDVVLGERRNRHTGTSGQFQLAVGRDTGHRVGHGRCRLLGIGIEQFAVDQGVGAALGDGRAGVVGLNRRIVINRADGQSKALCAQGIALAVVNREVEAVGRGVRSIMYINQAIVVDVILSELSNSIVLLMRR